MAQHLTGRREFLRSAGIGVLSAALSGCAGGFGRIGGSTPRGRPNILFCIADDWSWPHAGIAGDKVVKTPTFDTVAREGVLFENAFVAAPSCTPSRGSILTGQWHWRLEEGGNLWSTLPAKFPVYPDILAQAGYHVGYTRKGWGPGRHEVGGRAQDAAGPRHKNFPDFLKARPEGAPFCFWFGSYDPHRGYKQGSGVASGMNLDDVEAPACMPDAKVIRSDICDYFWEVQRFDTEFGELVRRVEKNGELDNTIVVVTGDNGMPFPRCKSNLYDMGTRVPLAVRWPAGAIGGRVVEDLVSLADLAPTFIEVAGLARPADMTGRSLTKILRSRKSGRIDRKRDRVFTGKERHAYVREGGLGYPCRAIRTHDFLYIRNFKPDRWPAGDPQPGEHRDPPVPFGDIDASPSKDYMMNQRYAPDVARLFELGFGKRPAEELYDLRTDPDQLVNVAQQSAYSKVKSRLAAALMKELAATRDPRVVGGGDVFDTYPYYGGRIGRMQRNAP